MDIEILRTARYIVSTPAWKHVLAELKQTAVYEFEGTQIGDDDARRSAWHMLDVVARTANQGVGTVTTNKDILLAARSKGIAAGSAQQKGGIPAG